jgi:hypothetical protein
MAMLVFPGDIERTEEHMDALFEQVDFQLTSLTSTASVISVVEGRPKLERRRPPPMSQPSTVGHRRYSRRSLQIVRFRR